MFGESGVAWLGRLPEILGTCAARWNLRVEPPFELSYNYVAPATRADGTEVVFKVGCPHPELTTEAGVLPLFSNEVTCTLLEYAPELGALLLERVRPGVPLTEVALEDDTLATGIAIELLRQLWREPPPGHPFPTVADWARGLDRHRAQFGGSGPLPAKLFDEAAECFAWLLETTTQPQLLHGDFHHDNVLSATRKPWLIIDPKGIVGDPGYDLGAFLYNPIPGLLNMPNPGRVTARRVDQLAEGLGMDRARIRGWGLAQAVLSACWSIEGAEDWRYAITCAEYVAAVKAD